ncbi:MAG: DHH family phosphoesterase [Pseudomonadota bacterium]
MRGSKKEQGRAMEEVTRLMASAGTFLVMSHRNPDGDAIGSALAVRHLLEAQGKKATVWVPDEVPSCYRFLPGAHEIVRSLPAAEAFDATIVVDTADPALLAEPVPLRETSGTVAIIDHHATGKAWGDIYLNIPAAAVGEIIFDLARAMSAELNLAFAECVYVAVMTDTGSFHYSSTTPKVMRLAAECLELGVLPWKMALNVYETFPQGRLGLLSDVLSTLEVDLGGRFATVTASLDMLARRGLGPDALEDFVNFPRGIEGVQVAALIRERDDGAVRVSLRSRGRVDVSLVALRFGGGGHHAAAGCTFKQAAGMDEVREALKRHLEETVLKPRGLGR